MAYIVGMGRKGMNSSDEFSNEVAREIQRAIETAGISNAEVMRRTHISQDYFYSRMRGEKPFNTNDVSRIAEAIGANAFAILIKAAEQSDLGLAASYNEDRDAEANYDADQGA